LSLSVDCEDHSFVTFLKDICTGFQNRELYRRIFRGFGDEPAISNVVDRIRFLHGIDKDYVSELSFCSSHFLEIEGSSVDKGEDSLHNMIYDRFVRASFD
jgi:hypothetical protein